MAEQTENKFESFLYKHKIISAFLVLWMVCLVSVITIKVFFAPVDIPAGTITAFGTVFGLPALVIGLWKWRNSKEKIANAPK